ncbi:MAG: hypothetical protein M3O35_12515 [Acidobacteriota bacterium]|nr:hypothetical protein [Acidobacteriota bacterium]
MLSQTQRIAAGSVALFLLNLHVAWRLLFVTFTKQLQSNEGTFIAISRMMRDHPGDLLWWPMWNMGIPFHHTYFPLLHALGAALSALAGVHEARAFHQVTALFYCLGPVTLFWLAARVSGRLAPSFAGALAYSLLSPASWLVQAIAGDVGGIWKPRRLQVLVYYGEGPHITSLALFGVALLLLYEFWKSAPGSRRQAWLGLAAGAFTIFTALTNAFGAVTLTIGVVCLLAALPRKEIARAALLSAMVGVVAYAAVCFWMPPSVIHAIRVNSPTVGGPYFYTARSWAGLAGWAAGFAVLWLAMAWAKASTWNRFIVLFAWVLSGITLLNFAGIYIVVQPARYQLEMEMGLLLCVAFGVEALLRGRSMTVQAVVVAAAVIFAVRQTVVYKHYARHLIEPMEITTTPEYKMARWVDGNADGGRVFIGGSYCFWTNVFTDVPQLAGGHDPTNLNPLHPIAVYEIYFDRDGPRTVKWLKALGVSEIGIADPKGHEYYKPFQNPDKFDGVLSVAWKEGADRIYDVPRIHPGFAHVIPRGSLVSRAPINGLDVDAFAAFVAALEDPALPSANLRWLNFHEMQIDAEVRPGQAISVQENFDPGWRAIVNGQSVPVRKDGLGFIFVEPSCDGPCRVELVWDGGTERRVTKMVSLGTMTGIGLWLVWRLGRRPGASLRSNRREGEGNR